MYSVAVFCSLPTQVVQKKLLFSVQKNYSAQVFSLVSNLSMQIKHTIQRCFDFFSLIPCFPEKESSSLVSFPETLNFKFFC